MNTRLLLSLIIPLVLSAFHQGALAVGGERDAHGCTPSAGYRWCEHTGKCERPWELAKQQGFPSSSDAFGKFCSSPKTLVPAPRPAPPRVGGDRDAHGCIPSAGYLWCERTKKCERPLELAKQQGYPPSNDAFGKFCSAPPAPAPRPAPPKVGGDRDAHGCIPSAGYLWCERTKKCERPLELAKQQGYQPSSDAFGKFCSAPPAPAPRPAPPTPPRVGGDRDAHGCIPSAGYQWCARTKKCERPWELEKQQGLKPAPDAVAKFCGK